MAMVTQLKDKLGQQPEWHGFSGKLLDGRHVTRTHISCMALIWTKRDVILKLLADVDLPVATLNFKSHLRSNETALYLANI